MPFQSEPPNLSSRSNATCALRRTGIKTLRLQNLPVTMTFTPGIGPDDHLLHFQGRQKTRISLNVVIGAETSASARSQPPGQRKWLSTLKSTEFVLDCTPACQCRSSAWRMKTSVTEVFIEALLLRSSECVLARENEPAAV